MNAFENKKCGARLLVASAVLTLASCGGGGGDSTQVTGSVAFSFPLPGGEVVGNTTTVTGTSTGDVDEVLVNGQQANSDDGFRNWRATVALPSTSTTIEIIGRVQGVEVQRASRSVKSQQFPLSRVDDLSREIGGIYVTWTSAVSALTRIDRNTGQRNRVVLDPGIGGATAYQIQDLEYDPGRNEAVLLETSQGPQFITVNFDNSHVISTPFPAAGGEVLREIEFDDVGDRLILKTEVTPPIALGTPNRIWTLHRGSLALTLVSDENSPGALNFLNLSALSWERTAGKLYAASAAGGDIIEVDLGDGSRSIVFDQQTATGPYSGNAIETLVALASPLRFGVLHRYISSSPASPFLYDVATSARTVITDVTPLSPQLHNIMHAAANGLRMIVNGRTIYTVDLNGQITLFEDLRIAKEFAELAYWVHPSFDSKRRRLVGASYNLITSFDPETGMTAAVQDDIAPLFGNPTYTDTTFYDAAEDAIIFASASGIAFLPAGGGSRNEARQVTYAQTGRPERGVSDLGFWWGWRDSFGGNNRFKVTYYGNQGNSVLTVDSQLTITQPHSYEFDFVNEKVYCVGSESGVNKVVSFDLATGSSTFLGSDGDGGPALAGTTSVLKIPNEDRLIVLANAGLISVDTVAGTRTLLDDFSQHPGTVDKLIGMTYDERNRVLYLTSYSPTLSIIAYELDSKSMQILAH